MANLNRIILVGRLTADPESRSTVDGLALSKFCLAVNRPQGGVDFIDVVAWRRLAEVSSQYLKKGQLALVDGRIHNHSFEDQTGQKRWVTEIVASNLQMLEQKSESLNIVADSETVMDDSDLESELPF